MVVYTCNVHAFTMLCARTTTAKQPTPTKYHFAHAYSNPTQGHSDWIFAGCWMNRDVAVTASRDGTVKLWSTSSDQLKCPPVHTLIVSTQTGVRDVACDTRPGSTLVTLTLKGTVQAWDTTTMQSTHKVGWGECKCFSYNPPSVLVATQTVVCTQQHPMSFLSIITSFRTISPPPPPHHPHTPSPPPSITTFRTRCVQLQSPCASLLLTASLLQAFSPASHSSTYDRSSPLVKSRACVLGMEYAAFAFWAPCCLRGIAMGRCRFMICARSSPSSRRVCCRSSHRCCTTCRHLMGGHNPHGMVGVGVGEGGGAATLLLQWVRMASPCCQYMSQCQI